MKLDDFNTMDSDCARELLESACSSAKWARRVVAHRPFQAVADLTHCAREQIRALGDGDIRDALAGHPRIGDRNVSGRSADEQARVSAADNQVLSELIALNELYEATFGHVYLVFAHGRSAEELVAVLKRRMSNDADVEWRNTRLELAKITEFRLRNLFGDERV